MFSLQEINDTVRVGPEQLGGELQKTILKNLQSEYEGMLDEEAGIVVAVTTVIKVGEGKVVPGDAGVYYSVDFNVLTYKPEVQEVVEGIVSQITEFGAFVKTGPIEALAHVSQVMDDYINYDPKNKILTGKESKKSLKAEDTVLARIVTVSLKGNISNSKIGLTMRQAGLGKKEWKKIDEKIKEKNLRQKAASQKPQPKPEKGAQSR